MEKYFKMNTNFNLHLNNIVFSIILYEKSNRVFLHETSEQTHETWVLRANKDCEKILLNEHKFWIAFE